MSSKATWTPTDGRFSGQSDSLLSAAIERTELPQSGESGARLEQLILADGTRLVVKEISPQWDWMMRATHDTGRAAELWVRGAMARCPPAIDPAIERIEQSDGGWLIFMRDVGGDFLRRGTRVKRQDARRLLAALAALHATYWDQPPAGLCRLEDLLTLVAPQTLDTFVRDHPFHAPAKRGWDVFFATAPTEIGDAVATVLADPESLADRLRRRGATLLHSDPHYGNVAPLPDRFVFIDWSLASAGPPALDFAWFLDNSARFVNASREQLVDDFRLAEGEHHDEGTLQIAFFAQLVLNGWGYADIADGADATTRQDRRRDFDWWVSAARRGLDAW